MAHRTALVIEGGGMKAAYANGVLSSFEANGHTTFDAVYGTSAGGALAAWFTAGQARFAEGTWKYAVDPRILSYGRFLMRRGHLLDHDGLLDIVYQREHPLDHDKVRKANQPVVVTASHIESARPVYQDLRRGDIWAWLKATGRLPFGCGPPVEIDGQHYLDGGILDPIPVAKAIADGATDVTVILNNPPGHRKKDNALLASLVARRFPTLRDPLLRHHAIKNAAMDQVRQSRDGVTIHVVRPATPTGLHRLTRDLDVIRTGLERGRSEGDAFLDGRKGTTLHLGAQAVARAPGVAG